MFANERAYDDLIQAAHDSFPTVPPALIAAVIGHESRFDPAAYRAEPAISDGSVGLGQVLLATARSYGYTGDVGDATALSGLFDPGTNIYYTAAALADRLAQTGNVVASAVSAYNGGYRPAQGFGAPATSTFQVCLARNTLTGQCIQWRTVQPGEYANQPYVDDVLKLYGYFQGVWGGGGGFPRVAASPAPRPAPRRGCWWGWRGR